MSEIYIVDLEIDLYILIKIFVFVIAGFNLYLVAAHEFGHALGLKHSRNPESLMYPTYHHSRQVSLLSTEDVANINTLYGKPTSYSFTILTLSPTQKSMSRPLPRYHCFHTKEFDHAIYKP